MPGKLPELFPGVSLSHAHLVVLGLFRADGSLRRSQTLHPTKSRGGYRAANLATMRTLEKRGYCTLNAWNYNWSAQLTVEGTSIRDRLAAAGLIQVPRPDAGPPYLGAGPADEARVPRPDAGPSADEQPPTTPSDGICAARLQLCAVVHRSCNC